MVYNCQSVVRNFLIPQYKGEIKFLRVRHQACTLLATVQDQAYMVRLVDTRHQSLAWAEQEAWLLEQLYFQNQKAPEPQVFAKQRLEVYQDCCWNLCRGGIRSFLPPIFR